MLEREKRPVSGNSDTWIAVDIRLYEFITRFDGPTELLADKPMPGLSSLAWIADPCARQLIHVFDLRSEIERERLVGDMLSLEQRDVRFLRLNTRNAVVRAGGYT